MSPSAWLTPEIVQTASRCRHYAMCKIDFLGTGLCPPAEDTPYVSHYPQGRMDLCEALANHRIPVTETAADIISSCTLCGRCDRQCHFITGMRPMAVMKAMKSFLAAYKKAGGIVTKTAADAALSAFQEVVGRKWAANDPAILIAYANDPFPLAGFRMPRYVVLPKTAEELIGVIDCARQLEIPCVVRGNGGSVFGFVFTDGVVIDVNRMKGIVIDPEDWTATVEPGVTSFELQTAAAKYGFRVNTAEPAATVCGNIVCTGMFSTWANAYGVGADHFVDLLFVDDRGRTFLSRDKSASNVFGFEPAQLPSPGTCVKAKVRMYPVTEDEDGLLVPFSSLADAASFARDLSRRRIGLAIGILGGHYLSTFISPTENLAEKIRGIFADTLEIAYAVCIVADRYARDAIRRMTPTVIDGDTFRMLMLGLPRLEQPEWRQIVQNHEGNAPAYEIVFSNEMRPVLETLLEPSPETLAQAVDADLKDFYVDLYKKPHMTDLVWLNMFRILSTRMSRHKHMFAFLVYVPLEMPVISRVIDELSRIADENGISHDFGFITPLDFGKRGILEYDYFIDQTDKAEAKRIEKAMAELDPLMDALSAEFKGVQWMKYIFSQGCARKEHYLYAGI